jgi:hypothetical protein
MRRVGWVVMVLALVAGGGATIASAGGGSNDARVDLRVGLHDGSGCEADSHALPVMVSVTDVEPGTATGPAIVCARSKGAADTRLTLAVTEMQDAEVGCTGDEAGVDSTCGGGQAGELARHLTVRLAVQPRCRGSFGPVRIVAFTELATTAHVVTPVMKSNQLDCVSLSLAYAPVSAEDAAAAQTDRVRWRYAFDLSG